MILWMKCCLKKRVHFRASSSNLLLSLTKSNRRAIYYLWVLLIVAGHVSDSNLEIA